ncbi:hypothetical protein ACIQRW_34235 [Streptomyces sp. NPDC091287]|uniref:hypothetical protein n=1 Tax=Streptomyces sp. NPDC091287 TaxID=3365988 RepID=UPI003802B395
MGFPHADARTGSRTASRQCPVPSGPDPNSPCSSRTRSASPGRPWPDVEKDLPCGGLSWGHGGSFPGYETRGGVTADGRAAHITVTEQLTGETARRTLERAVDTALCR